MEEIKELVIVIKSLKQSIVQEIRTSGVIYFQIENELVSNPLYVQVLFKQIQSDHLLERNMILNFLK